MIELECKRILYFSARDESAFFSWALEIPCVSELVGRGDVLVIKVRSKRMSNESLRELIALFQRYRIPMGQLAQFKTPRNESWFADPGAFWYRPVFVTAKPLS